MRRRTMQPKIRLFVSMLRSPVTLFDRGKRSRTVRILRRMRTVSNSAMFLATERVNSVPFNPLSTGQSKIGRRRPISLDYHCVNISQRIFINKISLERSFHYLNADTLLLKIGQEMTTLQPFEVTQLIDFALHRSTSVTCGRDFAHSITMVTWNV